MMSIRLKNPLVVRALTAALAGLVVAGICLSTARSGGGIAMPSGVDMRLPTALGEWRGRPGTVSDAEKEILPEDTEFAKMDYRRSGSGGTLGDRIHCSIVLSGKDRTSIHRPEVCLAGQGWNISSSVERTVVLRNDVELAVRCLELERGGETSESEQRAMYYYWFVGSEVTTADHLERILLTAKANVIENRNPRWAYVSVLAGVPPASSDADVEGVRSAAMLEDFIARITPEFQTAFAPAEIF